MGFRRLRPLIHAASLLTLVDAGVVAAGEPPYGKLLHDTECLTCHTETHYTRNSRLVHSLEELRKRVVYCRDDVGAEWDDAETEEVVQYINSFYKF